MVCQGCQQSPLLPDQLFRWRPSHLPPRLLLQPWQDVLCTHYIGHRYVINYMMPGLKSKIPRMDISQKYILHFIYSCISLVSSVKVYASSLFFSFVYNNEGWQFFGLYFLSSYKFKCTVQYCVTMHPHPPDAKIF